MAVTGPGTPTAEAAGRTVRSTLEVRVDTSFTRIYRFLRVLVRGLNRILFRTTVDGADQVPDDRSGDHRPGAPLLHRLLRGLRGHAGASSTTWPRTVCGGTGCWPGSCPAVGAFPVHRQSADREALRRAQQVLEAGEVLILFPEGERRTGPVVEDLHEGVAFLAARTGATVVPVGIGGSASVMPKGKRLPRPRHIHLVVGRPIAPPARTGGGRVSRSTIHRLTEELTASLQDLYDRSVEATGRY